MCPKCVFAQWEFSMTSLLRRIGSMFGIGLLTVVPLLAVMTWSPWNASAFDGDNGVQVSAFALPTASLASTVEKVPADVQSSGEVISANQQFEETAVNRAALRNAIRARLLAAISRFSRSPS